MSLMRGFGGYDAARARARRRKSAWNLLLIPGTVVGTAAAWFLAVKGAALVLGVSLRTMLAGDGAPQFLIALPPVFVALIAGMIVANCLVWLVRPAFRALQREAAPYPGLGFGPSTRALCKVLLFLLPPATALMALGIWLLARRSGGS
jgi:hypothetical protein